MILAKKRQEMYFIWVVTKHLFFNNLTEISFFIFTFYFLLSPELFTFRVLIAKIAVCP